MRQIIIIGSVALLIILLTGCAAARKRKITERGVAVTEADYASIMRAVSDYNVTDRGFVIRKGRIELEGTEIDGSFGLNVRLNRKGDFYASVRGPLGIELIRLLSVGDDIAAIDRISRTVYIGKKEEVLGRHGMPVDFMEIIFGDFPEYGKHNFKPVYGDGLIFSAADEDFEREVRICPEEMKICEERISSGSTGQEITLNFSEFQSVGDTRYASRIMMHEKKRMFHVKLTIEELEAVYDTDIEFALPSYKRSNL